MPLSIIQQRIKAIADAYKSSIVSGTDNTQFFKIHYSYSSCACSSQQSINHKIHNEKVIKPVSSLYYTFIYVKIIMPATQMKLKFWKIRVYNSPLSRSLTSVINKN